MVVNLPKGRQAQVVARPTVDNSRRIGQAALTAAEAFASNADNITTGVIQFDVLPMMPTPNDDDVITVFSQQFALAQMGIL